MFDTLRSDKGEESKASGKSPQEGRAKSNERISLPAEPADERNLLEQQRAVELLKEQWSLLAAGVEASRDCLEALIADARQVRDGWEGRLQKNLEKVQASGLEALRAFTAKAQNEFSQEIESRTRAVLGQAEKHIDEKTAAAVDSLGKVVQLELERAAREVTDRFRHDLRAIAVGFEKETLQKLQDKADGLFASAADRWQKQIDDSLGMLREGLIASGKRLSAEIEKQLEDARGVVPRLSIELKSAVEGCVSEFRTLIRDLRETSVQELKAHFEKELERQRDPAARQLQEQTRKRIDEARARIRIRSGESSHGIREGIHKPVGLAHPALKEGEDRPGGRKEGDSQQPQESFGVLMTDFLRAMREERRRRMRLLVDDLRLRMERAAKGLKGNATDG